VQLADFDIRKFQLLLLFFEPVLPIFFRVEDEDWDLGQLVVGFQGIGGIRHAGDGVCILDKG